MLNQVAIVGLVKKISSIKKDKKGQEHIYISIEFQSNIEQKKYEILIKLYENFSKSLIKSNCSIPFLVGLRGYIDSNGDIVCDKLTILSEEV